MTSSPTEQPTSMGTWSTTEEISEEDEDEDVDDVELDDVDLVEAPTGDPTSEQTETSIPTAGTASPTKAPTPQPTKQKHADATVKVINGNGDGSKVGGDGSGKGNGNGGVSVGFQSNWGPSYTGSMVYDFTRHSIYVTGTTYEANRYSSDSSSTSVGVDTDFSRSSCFVGHVPIADIQQWKTVGDPLPPQAADTGGSLKDFVIPDNLNAKEQMGCHAIYYDDNSGTQSDDFLYVGGVDEPNAEQRDGAIHAVLNVYQRTRDHPDWELKIQPQELQNPTDPATTSTSTSTPTPVRYPVAMTSGMDETDGLIVVVSVSSDDSLLTEEYIANGDTTNAQHNHKNALLPPGLTGGDPSHSDYFKRGSRFYMTYQIYGWDHAETGFAKRYSKTRKYIQGEDLRSAIIADRTSNIFPTGVGNLNNKGKAFVFVGHLQGQPPAEWTRMPLKVAAGDSRPMTNDLDGFASAVHYDIHGEPQWDSTLRFSSVEMNPPLDDYVHDICMGSYSTYDSKVDSYYVVGSTYGTMRPGTEQTTVTTNILSGETNTNTNGNDVDQLLSAFVSKIDPVSDTVLWTTQLYATTTKKSFDGKTEAFGCHVIPHDPSTMYIGGTVYDGAVMDTTTKSAGSDDVWVAQLHTNDGSLKWVRQIGSSGQDRVSRTNGVQADLGGNCILYGDTTGELYRPRDKDHNNDHDHDHGNNYVGTSDIFMVKLDRDNGSYASTVEFDRAATHKKKKKNGVIGVVGTVFILISLCMCFCVFYKFKRPRRRRRRRGRKNKNKNSIDEDAPDGIFSDIGGAISSYRDYYDNDAHNDADAAFDDVDDSAFDAVDNAIENGVKFNSDIQRQQLQNGPTKPPATFSYSDNAAAPAAAPSSSHPNGTLEMGMGMGGSSNSNSDVLSQEAFKDDPNYRPGRNFV